MRIKFDPDASGPLADVRVLDLVRLVAGNMLSLYLADFGADVIKVKRKEGNDLRRWRESGHEIYRKVYGRNKRSLVLDLKSAEGLAQLKKLVRHSQIVIENFVPGGLEKGIGVPAGAGEQNGRGHRGTPANCARHTLATDPAWAGGVHAPR